MVLLGDEDIRRPHVDGPHGFATAASEVRPDDDERSVEVVLSF